LPGLFLLPATLPKTVPSDDGLRKLPNVVLFPAGTHTDMHGRAEDYTSAYVERLARESEALRTGTNFRLEPPAVLGHEVDQSALSGILSADAVYQRLYADGKITSGGGPGATDKPAAGWPTNLRFENNALVADLDRIPPAVADKIDSGEYRYPSVEIKRGLTKPDGSKVDALWRVALLGGTPPACRNVPPFGETAAFADVVYFTDAAPDNEPAASPVRALLAKLWKLPAAFIAKLNRPQLDQLAEAAAGGHDLPAEIAAMADTNRPASLIDQLKALTDADRAALADLLKPTLTASFADQQKALEEKSAAALKRIEDRDAEERRKQIHAFCEAERGVHIRPADLDRTDHLNVKTRLLAIPPNEVLCFADADGKEVRKSRLEVEMEAIKDGPPLRSGPRIREFAGQPPRSDVKDFYARHPELTGKRK
jgi:hypothetical protein